MNRTNYIGNLVSKVALGATLLFSAPNVGANGGIALDQGSSTISREEIYSKLHGIENRLQRIEEQQNSIENRLTGQSISIGLAFSAIGYLIFRSFKKTK
ncbi:hypothetical protein HYV88_00185 [Candidatus Woesearchaeota archaeon]|nr:hypothetical protein [Candidatus Woesearchaeota archaeon]